MINKYDLKVLLVLEFYFFLMFIFHYFHLFFFHNFKLSFYILKFILYSIYVIHLLYSNYLILIITIYQKCLKFRKSAYNKQKFITCFSYDP